MSITRRRSKRWYCSECIKIRDYPSWRPSKKREYELRRHYGIGTEEWDAIFAAQGSQCAVCRTTDFGVKGPTVDHCHQSGLVRGILCTPCNTGIGSFKDSPAHLRAAANYVEKHQKARIPAA